MIISLQGLGTDIIEVRRIRDALERFGDRFLNRLFTELEIEYCLQFADPAPRVAGRFAAKEAIVKAFGIVESISWKEIEVLNNMQGKPEVFLSLRVAELFQNTELSVSISHCKEYATATAILMAE